MMTVDPSAPRRAVDPDVMYAIPVSIFMDLIRFIAEP